MGPPSRHNLWNKCLSMAVAFQKKKKKVKRSIHATCNGSKVPKKKWKRHIGLCAIQALLCHLLWCKGGLRAIQVQATSKNVHGMDFKLCFPTLPIKRPLSHPQKPWEQFLERTIILEKNYSSENSLLPSASPPLKGRVKAQKFYDSTLQFRSGRTLLHSSIFFFFFQLVDLLFYIQN